MTNGGDTGSLGRAGRDGVKTERAREMSPADRRRVLLVDDGLHDQGVGITELEPATDQFGRPLPVVQEDEHQGLLHLDGKGEVRPPKAWEEQQARERRDSFSRERAVMTASLRRHRAALPVFERLRAVMQEMGKLQTPRAQQRRETDSRSAAVSQHAGPQGEGFEAVAYFDAHEIDRHLRLIALHVEALEDALDEHHGAAHKSYVLMVEEDKDRLIIGPKYRGLPPEAVHVLHPELGSARKITRVRGLAGLDKYGRERATKEAA